MIRTPFAILRMCMLPMWIAATAATATDPTPLRFVSDGRAHAGAAEWITRDHDRVAFGAGHRLTVVSVVGDDDARRDWTVDAALSSGVLAGTKLYAVATDADGDALVAIDVTVAEAAVEPLGPRSHAGSMRLTQMDDHLVVAAGTTVGLWRLPAVHRAADGTVHVMGEALVEVGRIPLNRTPLSLEIGPGAIIVMTDEGLMSLDPRRAGSATGPDANVARGSMLLLGRTLFVAAGDAGVLRYRDRSPARGAFVVQVGDVFFDPPGALDVNVGDTVRWSKPATVFTHNVRSCTALQTGCGGATARESFTSGAVTTSSFTFDHTFVVPGGNPYVCQSHALSMVGDVRVTDAGPAPPPAVPDGEGGLQPMTVGKVDPAGDDLDVAFDVGCPDAVGTDLLYGSSATLPGSPGGTYGLDGAACAVGGSPFTWLASPAVAPGDFLWWVLVADDGGSVEGSWGTDGSANQRDGAGANGASGLCGNTTRDLSNTCGH